MQKSLFDRYRIRITDTHRKAQYLPPMSIYSMRDMEGNSLDMTTIMTEKMYVLEIRESDLDRLENDLKYFHEYPNPYDRADYIEREVYLRKNNPAVRKAWENYKMLLKLAADGKTLD